MLERGDGLGAAGVGGRVGQRAALDVEVDLGEPVGVDDLAVRLPGARAARRVVAEVDQVRSSVAPAGGADADVAAGDWATCAE
ncbi:hypothetical protein STENM327S_05174 [Streptomyces tendae]